MQYSAIGAAWLLRIVGRDCGTLKRWRHGIIGRLVVTCSYVPDVWRKQYRMKINVKNDGKVETSNSKVSIRILDNRNVLFVVYSENWFMLSVEQLEELIKKAKEVENNR